jgi:kumamolisin
VTGEKITEEVVWNDDEGGATGGGVSILFPKPSWQSSINVPPNSAGRS